MAKDKTTYVCSSCGAHSPQWRGQCLQCKAWNTLEQVVVPRAASGRVRGVSAGATGATRAVPLAQVDAAEGASFGSGMTALDDLLGGGLVPGQAILLGGEPGVGKSTLLMQLAGAAAAAVRNGGGSGCIYATGEESLSQIRTRAERLGVLHPELMALATAEAGDVAAIMHGENAPALVIVDSVQTMVATGVEGLPGSVGQVRAVATELVEAAKRSGACLILVGHVTKDGQIAGPKLLEHMVDTVLSMEGDRSHLFRVLRVLKNRFGPTQDLLLMQMLAKGLEVVHDPSTFFLGARDESLSGAAEVMAVDGQRPFAVEVQALVSRTFLSIPRRTALGFDVNRLHLLLAVLEKRLNLNLGQVDVYVKIGGGLRMQDPGMDLGIVAAVLSSFYDRPLSGRPVFWGEVDLNGQVRPVAGQEVRMGQAGRLGYSDILAPRPPKGRGGVASVGDLQTRLFGPPR